MNSQKGFTLIELLVVVLIIGILSAVALPQYHQAVWKARFAKIYPIMADIERQVEMYRLEEGSYPTKCVDIALTLPNGAVMNEEGSYCNFKVGDDLYFTVGPERAWAQLYQGNPDGGLFVEL